MTVGLMAIVASLQVVSAVSPMVPFGAADVFGVAEAAAAVVTTAAVGLGIRKRVQAENTSMSPKKLKTSESQARAEPEAKSEADEAVASRPTNVLLQMLTKSEEAPSALRCAEPSSKEVHLHGRVQSVRNPAHSFAHGQRSHCPCS